MVMVHITITGKAELLWAHLPNVQFFVKGTLCLVVFIKTHRAKPYFRGEIFAAGIFQRLPCFEERSLCVWVSTHLNHKCSKCFSARPKLLFLMYFTGAVEIAQWLMCFPRVHENLSLTPSTNVKSRVCQHAFITSVLLGWTQADPWSLL